MTTTSTPQPGETAHPARDTDVPARRSLLRAELHRFTARRFIRVLVLLALVAFLGIVTLMALTVFTRVDAQELAQAELRRGEAIAQWEMCRQNDEERPADVPAEEFCGAEPTAENVPIEAFIDGQPFVLASFLPGGAVLIGSLTAVLAFLIGATYVGAEWSTRSMVALLFWEPRRLRVIAAKLLATAVMAALLGVLAQVLWTVTAQFLARTRGTSAGLPRDFWSDLVAQQGRCVLLVVLMALLGFGLANLIRNTGASLGVGFVYFAIIENVIRVVRPAWQEWLITTNISALLAEGGTTIFVGPGIGQDPEMQPREIVLSNLHGGLVLFGVTAAVVAVGVVLFKRRDLH